MRIPVANIQELIHVPAFDRENMQAPRGTVRAGPTPRSTSRITKSTARTWWRFRRPGGRIRLANPASFLDEQIHALRAWGRENVLPYRNAADLPPDDELALHLADAHNLDGVWLTAPDMPEQGITPGAVLTARTAASLEVEPIPADSTTSVAGMIRHSVLVPARLADTATGIRPPRGTVPDPAT